METYGPPMLVATALGFTRLNRVVCIANNGVKSDFRMRSARISTPDSGAGMRYEPRILGQSLPMLPESTIVVRTTCSTLLGSCNRVPS